jgi:hypothetical protein
MRTCRWLSVRLASLSVFGALGLGCGGSAADPPPVVVNPGNTVTVSSPEVSATRFPSTCGVTDPPFTSTDDFSLEILLGPRTETPYNELSVEYEAGVVVGKPIALTVAPFQAHGSEVGDGPCNFDQVAFDSVTLTFEAIPTEDGAPLTVRLQVHFTDGKVLDETFSADLTTDAGGCPAG